MCELLRIFGNQRLRVTPLQIRTKGNFKIWVNCSRSHRNWVSGISIKLQVTFTVLQGSFSLIVLIDDQAATYKSFLVDIKCFMIEVILQYSVGNSKVNRNTGLAKKFIWVFSWINFMIEPIFSLAIIKYKKF